MEIDNFGHNRFYKKKTALELANALFADLTEKVCFNQTLELANDEEKVYVRDKLKILSIKLL